MDDKTRQALWQIATGRVNGEPDCLNAEVMRGIAQEALGDEWTDYLDHQKREAENKVVSIGANS